MKENKVIIGFCVFAVLFFAANIAWSHDYHHEHSQPSAATITDNKGVALAIAKTQHHFYLGTHDAQWSAGFGSFDGKTAISFSAGKKLDKVFISGSIGVEDDEIGVGIGIGGKF